MDSAGLNQYSYRGSFTYFDTLGFQVEIEKKQTPFTITKLNTVHTGVFTYQPAKYEWITGLSNSESRCSDKQEYLIDKNSWSLIIEEINV